MKGKAAVAVLAVAHSEADVALRTKVYHAPEMLPDEFEHLARALAERTSVCVCRVWTAFTRARVRACALCGLTAGGVGRLLYRTTTASCSFAHRV